jgi:hypothetical protein
MGAPEPTLAVSSTSEKVKMPDKIAMREPRRSKAIKRLKGDSFMTTWGGKCTSPCALGADAKAAAVHVG